MKKGVNKAIACALIGTIALTGTAFQSQAAGTALAGADLTIEEAIAANVNIVKKVTPIVKSEFDSIAIAQVESYVNIRDAADEEGNVLGKIYNDSAATILEEEGEWFKVKSGTVTGYVKSEYFATGDEAAELAKEVGQTTATVETETLYVRNEANQDADILTMVGDSEKLTVVDEEDEWVKVAIDSDVVGYVSGDYVSCETTFKEAESVEEEAYRIWLEEEAKRIAEEARIAAEQEAARIAAEEEAARVAAEEEAARQAEAEANQQAEQEQQVEETPQEDNSTEDTQQEEAPQETSAPETEAPQTEAPQTEAPQTEAPQTEAPSNNSTSSSREGLVNFALQFVGNPYVWGGTSLTNGADCSGFVMSVYSQYAGISLPRVASAQAGAGTPVSVSDIQPGDLLFYGDSSGIGHVAIYIGNGQVVHASSSTTGIKTSTYNYRTIVKAVSVL